MIIVLPTIMHTGTFLMMEGVFKDYRKIGVTQKHVSDSVIHCHTANNMFYAIADCMDKYPSVVPMRHPARVWQSFKRRNGSLNDRMFREQFGCMDDLTKGRDVFYIHIDQPEIRDSELTRINKSLGLALKTDWPLLNVVGNTNELELTRDMIDEVPQWIMDYYQSTYLSDFGKWKGVA